MPGNSTRGPRMRLGGRDFPIRVLSHRQQHCDGDGAVERIGVSSARWSLFDQLRPAVPAPAAAMVGFGIGGRRIPQSGCGLGLAGQVVPACAADVTASDHHPLAAAFHAHDAAANGPGTVACGHPAWVRPDTGGMPGCTR
ncbi:hypothetical protein [Coralloluteibacterium stylophorae]|uniref:hypothetical protein n=1 Tax=Coralloluteibacterium stylophorae TaxID=1776034 RepID=UPI001FE7210D|nr:hypothetical protein [Coralloluteibacterium stylophorae]